MKNTMPQRHAKRHAKAVKTIVSRELPTVGEGPDHPDLVIFWSGVKIKDTWVSGLWEKPRLKDHVPQVPGTVYRIVRADGGKTADRDYARIDNRPIRRPMARGCTEPDPMIPTPTVSPVGMSTSG